MMTEKSQTSRVVYLDFLRIFAALAVILIHVSDQNLSVSEISSYPWTVFTVLKQAGCWAVPVFIMISGALFLDPDRPLTLRKLYGVNLVRIVTAFFFWALVYALEKYLVYRNFKIALSMFLGGRYHMWYLFMIAGLYVATPVVRKITESRQITEYFLILSALFLFLIPGVLHLCEWLDFPGTSSVLDIFKTNLDTIAYPFPTIYLFYFVLGYYLAKFDLPPRWITCSFAAGIVGYLAAVAVKLGSASLAGGDSLPLTFDLNSLAVSAGVFLFGKHILGKTRPGPAGLRVLHSLSQYSFGAYLVHALVLSQFRDRFGLTTLSFDPLLSVILIEVCAAAASFFISMLLNQIPILKKYIV